MATYPDYTESIAKLEGLGAASLGTVGNAIQAAPQALGAAGNAMEGIGKNLDQARFEALKAQGIDTLIQAAIESNFKPEQMAVLKTIWNTEDGQNKAYALYQSMEKQNKKEEAYNYQKSWLASQTGSESEANAALADSQATGNPIMPPPAIGEQSQPIATNENPEYPGTLAPPALGIGETPKAFLPAGSPQQQPETMAYAKKNPIPETPVIKTQLPANEKEIDLQHARLVAGLQKYGMTEDDLSQMEPLRKILTMRIVNPDSKPDEIYKLQKQILSDPKLVEGLGDPASPISIYFNNFPKDPGTESIAKDLQQLVALQLEEEKAGSKSNKDKSRAFYALQKENKDNPGFVSFTNNAYSAVDRFGLYGPLDPEKISAKGFVGALANLYPSKSKMSADLLDSMGATTWAEALRNAVKDTQYMKSAVIEGILHATGKASSDKERQYITTSMGFVNWNDPKSVKEGLEKYYTNRYGDYEQTQSVPIQAYLSSGGSLDDIARFKSVFNTKSPKDYYEEKYGSTQSSVPSQAPDIGPPPATPVNPESTPKKSKTLTAVKKGKSQAEIDADNFGLTGKARADFIAAAGN